jgi:rod shape-determining protein MreD
MAVVIAIPILVGLLILQTAVISHVTLLQGAADLVLVALVAWGLQKRVQTALVWGLLGGLLVGYVSALPVGVIPVAYLLAVGLALVLRRRVWELPILAMLIATFFGTLIVHLVQIAGLRIVGTELPFWQALNRVTLPSVLLNLLLAIPFYALFNDLARWLYPEPLDV